MNNYFTTQEKLQKLASAVAKVNDLKVAGKCEDSLLEFCEYVWPVVEPAIKFERGWVLEAIAEHLEAVTYGHIKRLLINVPPGFTKSLMTDVFWPAWEWGPRNMPSLRYVCASYSSHLTERDNMRCRNIVVSDRYKRLWGHRFNISNEQFTKVKFANDHTGWKLATSVGGVGVGERGDRFIIDDPNNTMEMESEPTRATTNMWFTEVVPDRLNSQKDSAIVIIMQRLHEDDVSGTALSRDMGYTHLMIPMEHDTGGHCVTLLGTNESDEEVYWEDPRTEEYELAWPDRFPQQIVDDLKRDKGPYAFAGQYQQSPEIRGGSIIKRDFWQRWEEPVYPTVQYVLASLDTAYTEKEENDASALTVWGVFRFLTREQKQQAMEMGMDEKDFAAEYGQPRIILMYAWNERLEFNDLVNKVIDTCSRDKRILDHKGNPMTPYRYSVDRLLIEDKASGHSAAQELQRVISFTGKFGVELVKQSQQGDKWARVNSIQHLFSEGLIYVPWPVDEYGKPSPLGYEWVNRLVEQCAMFPKGSHDDLVDSTSQALRYLRAMNFTLRNEEHAEEMASQFQYRGKMQPLYPC